MPEYRIKLYRKWYYVVWSGDTGRTRRRALRTPYFFKDRDLVVNENGRRKPIFHIVRTFQRSDGKFVKSHFRGARRFTWNGYGVNITMPGLHHRDEAEMDFYGHTEGADGAPQDAITITEFARRVDQYNLGEAA